MKELLLSTLLAVLLLPLQADAQQRLPIIDMHLHAFGYDEFGFPPPPNKITGQVPGAKSNQEAIAATLQEMERHAIVLAVASGPLEHVARYQGAAPGRIIGGAYTGGRDPLPEVSRLSGLFQSGSLGVLGELGLQYRGLKPGDPSLNPYFAMAEELDVPVAIHTGIGDEGIPYRCCPDFRIALGNPNLIEDVLIRYPALRVQLMHGGYPYLQETKALLHVYPQVYVDIAVINWILPRKEFHGYLKALVDAGFGKRIMFGSDQMVWPETIGMAIEGVESASFLGAQQKRDIFYNNAARFLGLGEQQIAQHHGS